MGGSSNPVKKVVNTAKSVIAPVAKLAAPVVEPVVKLATDVVSAVPVVGKPVAQAVNQVSQAVGVTEPPPAPSSQPTEQAIALGDSTSETIANPQIAVASKASEAPGQSGGELEVKKGSGRLNKNIQRNRASFNVQPTANTGAAGSSIRI